MIYLFISFPLISIEIVQCISLLIITLFNLTAIYYCPMHSLILSLTIFTNPFCFVLRFFSCRIIVLIAKLYRVARTSGRLQFLTHNADCIEYSSFLHETANIPECSFTCKPANGEMLISNYCHMTNIAIDSGRYHAPISDIII